MLFRIYYIDKWHAKISMIYEATNFRDAERFSKKLGTVTDIVPMDPSAESSKKLEALWHSGDIDENMN
jgi:hypothetical protein